ncbi:MAG: hypothetical protein LPK19_17450, partial [Hymenobacteraceae bacterium]|nr:hypothetical protein [Hymenobacteraceae bacterium]MDX5398042.1 hypothetical protein [Hymenobacteraceae bacterium]MDX5514113.1 hypothetical protein [Hymenobacteraceae bacterium]
KKRIIVGANCIRPLHNPKITVFQPKSEKKLKTALAAITIQQFSNAAIKQLTISNQQLNSAFNPR